MLTEPAGQKMPAPQGMQLVEPSNGAYVPAGHRVQASTEPAPAGPDVPAGQRLQTLIDVAPTVNEYVPAAQSIQAAAALVPPSVTAL